MNQLTPWEIFERSQTKDDMRLFRLLQRVHYGLGRGRAMFAMDWLTEKQMIEEFIEEKFGVDLNNLPRSKWV